MPGLSAKGWTTSVAGWFDRHLNCSAPSDTLTDDEDGDVLRMHQRPAGQGPGAPNPLRQGLSGVRRSTDLGAMAEVKRWE